MRDSKEILNEARGQAPAEKLGLILEVLLDIRNQEKKPVGRPKKVKQ
jgi:hypothetical protein